MNPADLYRNDTFPQPDSTPPLSSKTLPGSAFGQKNVKAVLTNLRVDTEPIYTQLRAALGEHFAEYKTALSAFFLGKLNKTELDSITSPLLSPAHSVANPTHPLTTPLKSTLQLHNTLIAALLANVYYRDPPPDPIAPWVLSTDTPAANAPKPASGAAGAGDKVEERIKREVMALSARDRRRIKGIKDGERSNIDGAMVEALAYRDALEAVPTSVAGSELLGATGGLGRTNFDVEIRRRFALPLGAETCEFPARGDIQSRIEPICYEEGLGGGVAGGALQACAELVETAAEMFVKELVGAWTGIARVNAEAGPQTNRFKRQLRREEMAAENGEIGRSLSGLLPVEADAAARREPLGLEDVRLALRLDGGRLRQDQFLAQQILEEAWMDVSMDEGDGMIDGVLPTLDLDVNGNGPKHEKDSLNDPMVIDDAGWGWHGGGTSDRDTLMDVLGGALAVGS